MRRSVALTLVLALLSSLLLAATVRAQAQPQGGGLYRIEGTVIAVNKEASTITIRQRSRTNMAWTVHYTDATSFSYRNTATSLEDVKNGRRVICLGRYEQKGAKNEMTAVVVDGRSGKEPPPSGAPG
jgi:hypothetical protein